MMKRRLLITTALIYAFSMIVFGLYSHSQKVEAISTGLGFGGIIGEVTPCCNGIKFVLVKPSEPGSVAGPMIMPWSNMVPNPFAGLGLYRWWALTPGQSVLGDAIPGGECEVIYQCVPEPVPFTVKKVGVTLREISS
jgi:hypothetical protein